MYAITGKSDVINTLDRKPYSLVYGSCFRSRFVRGSVLEEKLVILSFKLYSVAIKLLVTLIEGGIAHRNQRLLKPQKMYALDAYHPNT